MKDKITQTHFLEVGMLGFQKGLDGKIYVLPLNGEANFLVSGYVNNSGTVATHYSEALFDSTATVLISQEDNTKARTLNVNLYNKDTDEMYSVTASTLAGQDYTTILVDYFP